MNIKNWLIVLAASAVLSAPAMAHIDDVRIKDLARIAGNRENALVGYGLVTGLAGSGDSPRNRSTRRSIANMLAKFDLAISSEEVQSRNVAAVMITASLPAFGRPGDAFDITVTSVGDARSLTGGTLLLAPLKAVDGRVYALAQGAVTVGGYKVDANGNVIQKNHPTTGSVPNGATVERLPAGNNTAGRESIVVVLSEPDYTTASRVAAAINRHFGSKLASARDASGIEVQVPPQHRAELANFITGLEQIRIVPDVRARVVINERTGTVVSGEGVKISRVTISHGELKVTVTTETSVSQPALVAQTGDEVRTQVVTNSRLSVDESDEPKLVTADAGTVGDLVRALTRLKTNTRDIISVLRAIKSAGALHAELVVQ